MDLGAANNLIQDVLWVSGAAYWVRRMRRDKKLEFPFTPKTWVIATLFVVGIAISSSSLYFSLHPRTVEKIVYRPTPRIILAWGTGGPDACAERVGLDSVVQYKDSFDVVAACGIIDPTVDKMDDDRITVSSARTIIGGQVDIVTPTSPKMRAATEQLHKIGVGTFSEWYEVILLPKGESTSAIQRLSDVHRYGGKILSQDPY